MMLTPGQREALKLLVSAAESYTVPALVRFGFTVEALRRLVRDGVACAERMQVQAAVARGFSFAH
jgi:hydroxymethylglutaryl-CoA reductase